jgi:hypothetical protein
MGRFSELVDIDDHGVYVTLHDVIGLLPIRPGLVEALNEKEQALYDKGARSWIVVSQGFMHASLATVEEIHARIIQLEQKQREAAETKSTILTNTNIPT